MRENMDDVREIQLAQHKTILIESLRRLFSEPGCPLSPIELGITLGVLCGSPEELSIHIQPIEFQGERQHGITLSYNAGNAASAMVSLPLPWHEIVDQMYEIGRPLDLSAIVNEMQAELAKQAKHYRR